jgi:hypothetical protein
MKVFAYTLTLIASALLPFNAMAVYECNVTVKNVLVYSSGMVNLLHSGRGDYTFICNLSEDYRGVSVTTCAMWTAMLQAIKKKNGLANIYYDGTGSCATLPNYSSAPIPVYIGDVTP